MTKIEALNIYVDRIQKKMPKLKMYGWKLSKHWHVNHLIVNIHLYKIFLGPSVMNQVWLELNILDVLLRN